MADVLAVRNEYRLKTWTKIIRECRESGLSNREFCAQRGIGEKTYYDRTPALIARLGCFAAHGWLLTAYLLVRNF